MEAGRTAGWKRWWWSSGQGSVTDSSVGGEEKSKVVGYHSCGSRGKEAAGWAPSGLVGGPPWPVAGAAERPWHGHGMRAACSATRRGEEMAWQPAAPSAWPARPKDGLARRRGHGEAREVVGLHVGTPGSSKGDIAARRGRRGCGAVWGSEALGSGRLWCRALGRK